MTVPELEMDRLHSSHILESFKCETTDLNDFLINDALQHQKELIAVTYLFNIDSKLVAYLSLSNDIVHEQLFEDSKQFEHFRKKLPWGKRYRHLPAVKIGRLGVDITVSRQGIGTRIVDLVKNTFTINNKTGCRFITVDAHNNPKTLNFYQKNEFEFFTKTDEDLKTRSMYFDLMRIVSARIAS